MWFNIRNPIVAMVSVCCGKGGGGLSPLAGASACSSMPYIRDTMPTSCVTFRVTINWVGSSNFFLSNVTLPPLKNDTKQMLHEKYLKYIQSNSLSLSPPSLLFHHKLSLNDKDTREKLHWNDSRKSSVWVRTSSNSVAIQSSYALLSHCFNVD